MMHKRWTMLVSGKVQGVCYRASTEDVAHQLRLTGYARNLPDGRVEVVAEGAHEDLQALRDWCEEGPPAAVVDTINATEGPATGEFTNFGIR
ncbi:acylphosphatase [uncultured Marinobacter sp.]|uniref:acylphosphatase n=1 Tax=uncultured Marinobacter sp. TaxID=187379 RepID=UPI002601B0F5|nr:acylphosphatase [uncultured Marinobacter sp.]